MAKDPAFLFYSQDWVVGCQTLSMTERGQYITLISMMHQMGRMDEETIRLLVGSVSVRLLAKFEQDDAGFYYSKRLEKEVFARQKFVESRRINGAKGGRSKDSEKKKNNKPTGKPKANLMEDVDVNENEIENNNKRCENLNFGTLQKDFSIKWSEWIAYKKSQHNEKYKTLQSEQKAVDHLIDVSGGDSINAGKIIGLSIANLWKGLFEIDKKTNHGNSKNANPSSKINRIGRMAVEDAVEYKNRPISDFPI